MCRRPMDGSGCSRGVGGYLAALRFDAMLPADAVPDGL